MSRRGPLNRGVGEPLAQLSRLLRAGVVESELDMAVEALVGAASAAAAVVLVGRKEADAAERWHGFDNAQREQVRPLLGADPVVPQQLKLGGERPLLVHVMPLGHGAHGAAAVAFDVSTPAGPRSLEAADHVVAILAAKLAEERRVAAMRSELSRAKRWFEITGMQLKILDRERQKFAAVVSQSDTFVLVVDAGRVVRWVNGALRHRLARPEAQRGDELQVDAIWDLLGVDVKQAGCPVTRVLGEGRVEHVESQQSYDGEVHSLYLTLLPIKGVRGETAEVLVMIQDLSDLDLLRRPDCAGNTHEFNKIMTEILAQSELLNARAGGNPELEEIAEKISKAAVRAAPLTRKLLAFSREELVQAEAEPELGTGQAERILLVDNDPEVRSTAAHLLTLDGYETTVAASAEEALELFKAASEPYQLLLAVQKPISRQMLSRVLRRVLGD